MPYVDLVIVVVILIFSGKGFIKGFFNEFLTFLGFIVAFFFSTNMYKEFGTLISSILGVSQSLSRFVAFLIIFLIIIFAFAAAGHLLSKGAKKLKVGGMDRTLGAVFGAAKGALLIGVILTVLYSGNAPSGSFLAPFVTHFFDQAMNIIDLKP
jgi:membrane protein required for colicin V production